MLLVFACLVHVYNMKLSAVDADSRERANRRRERQVTGELGNLSVGYDSVARTIGTLT